MSPSRSEIVPVILHRLSGLQHLAVPLHIVVSPDRTRLALVSQDASLFTLLVGLRRYWPGHPKKPDGGDAAGDLSLRPGLVPWAVGL